MTHTALTQRRAAFIPEPMPLLWETSRCPRAHLKILLCSIIMGADKIGRYLEEKLMPKQIEAYYTPELQRFEQERENYLLPQYGPSTGVMVSEIPLCGDLYPFIDGKT